MTFHKDDNGQYLPILPQAPPGTPLKLPKFSVMSMNPEDSFKNRKTEGFESKSLVEEHSFHCTCRAVFVAFILDGTITTASQSDSMGSTSLSSNSSSINFEPQNMNSISDNRLENIKNGVNATAGERLGSVSSTSSQNNNQVEVNGTNETMNPNSTETNLSTDDRIASDLSGLTLRERGVDLKSQLKNQETLDSQT